MKRKIVKPVIFVSKCLTRVKCRWDGVKITDKFVKKLKPRVTYITVCPELEIGLGVPRDAVRIVRLKNSYKLIQPNTKKDLTKKINAFTSKYLASIKKVDGFILKDRSPSCGIKNVKVYAGLKSRNPIARSSGFFAKGVLENFPDIPIETDVRLAKPAIRKRLLKRMFV